MKLLCAECKFPGILHPIRPVQVGTLKGEPVYRNLCNVCAANARRKYSNHERRKQADREQREAAARYGE